MCFSTLIHTAEAFINLTKLYKGVVRSFFVLNSEYIATCQKIRISSKSVKHRDHNNISKISLLCFSLGFELMIVYDLSQNATMLPCVIQDLRM